MGFENLPVGLQLSRIHDFLKAELAPLSSEDIKAQMGIDIDASPEIFQALTSDSSKVLREKDGRWRWSSKYLVKNINELIVLIVRSSDGIFEKDLYDSYKGIKDDIKKLKKRGALYEIKSGSKILIFPQDSRLKIDIGEEVKTKYKEVRVPDAIEIHRYLVQHGLKETDDKSGVRIAQPVSRKRPKTKQGGRRRTRRIKLTNTHLKNSDIDLSKDYNTGKDSAFG